MIRVQCPICEKTMHGRNRAEWTYFPFCSERCRLIDLGRWLGEEYRCVSPAEGLPAPDPDVDDIP